MIILALSSFSASAIAPSVHPRCDAFVLTFDEQVTRLGISNEPLQIVLPRLVLRPGYQADLFELQKILRNEDIVQNYIVQLNWSDDDTKAYLGYFLEAGVRREPHAQTFTFVVQSKDPHEVIGLGTLRKFDAGNLWEIGYAVKKLHRGKGYAREIIQGLVDYIQRVDSRAKIQAKILERNIPSQRLIESMGFRQVIGPNKEYFGEKVLYFQRQL